MADQEYGEPIVLQNERLLKGLQESYQARCMMAQEREAWKDRALREIAEVNRLRAILAAYGIPEKAKEAEVDRAESAA